MSSRWLARKAIGFGLWVMIGLLAVGLYRARQRPRAWESAARVLIGTAIGGFFYVLFFYIVADLNTGRSILVSAMAMTCIIFMHWPLAAASHA